MAADPATFCDEIRGRLVGALTLWCGDRWVAEELAQEALARAWERWPAVSEMDAPEAWTFRTATNLATSWLRRRVVERRARARMEAARPADVPDDAAVVAVRAAVASLPPRQRSVVVARFFLDLSVEETAEMLGCAPGTVKATTHQAIERLRASGLVHDGDDDENEIEVEVR